MNDSALIACPSCLRTNRLPQLRLSEQPKCGSCKSALFTGEPIAATEQSFDSLVGRTSLPVVVDCWAPWCGPCLQFAPAFAAAAQQLEPNYRLIKLDTEANPQTAARLAIRSIPTLIILREGAELARTSGAMPLRQFLSWVQRHTDP